MHPLLKRQLRKLELSEDAPPTGDDWQTLLGRVSRAYAAADQDRYITERSMELSSAEMMDLHRKLEDDREWLDVILQSLDDGVLVLDENLDVQLANAEASRMLQVELPELRHWRAEDLAGCCAEGSSFRVVIEQMTRQGPQQLEYQRWDDVPLTGKAGSTLTASIGLTMLSNDGIVVTLRDMSMMKHMELELRHAQRLESIGRLAAGVAHEINTPMQFVGDNLRFVLECIGTLETAARAAVDARRSLSTGNVDDARAHLGRVEDDDDLDDAAGEILQALEQSISGIERVTTIVRAMKAFGHPGTRTFGGADINAALENTITVARSELQGVATVTTDFATLPIVPCILADLNQVFLNIIVNAAHAIAERQIDPDESGEIHISTRHDDEFVEITISDNGIGIAAEHAEHVFDPFFTTKEVGGGTGQGLALARNIVVDRHGGSITFDSNVGVGTKFVIRLPLEQQ